MIQSTSEARRLNLSPFGVHINKEEKEYTKKYGSKIKKMINGFLTYKNKLNKMKEKRKIQVSEKLPSLQHRNV